MRKSFVAVALLALASTAPLAAQQPASVTEEIRLTREQIARDRQEIVRQALKLDSAQSVAFWPIYKEYKAEQEKIGDKSWKALTEFGKNYDRMDDATAKVVLDNWTAASEDRAKLAKKWRGKFVKAIGEKPTLRFYQIEAKLDYLVQGEVIAQIPLAK
jgi:hypothetical protein